jgi:hypothetical protein
MNVLKPNKSEQTVIIIIVSIFAGFSLGVLSMTSKVNEKDKQIKELLDATSVLLNDFE